MYGLNMSVAQALTPQQVRDIVTGETDARIKSRVEQLTIGKPEQFFDLRTDPDERVNLIADAKHAAEIMRLKQLLLTHMEKTADPQLENFRKLVK